VANTLAYYENPQITAVKSLIVQALAFFQEQMNTGLREVLLRWRLSMVDLLVVTSLDRLLFILKILFTFFTKQPTSIRRSIVLSLPPQLVFPWRNHSGDTQLYRQEKGRLQFWPSGKVILVFQQLLKDFCSVEKIIIFLSLSVKEIKGWKTESFFHILMRFFQALQFWK